MCYSARVVHDYRRYLRAYGADVDLETFYDIFWRRRDDRSLKLPKAMEAGFDAPGPEDESPRRQRMRLEIRESILAFRADEARRLEEELFAQRKRLADAERRILSSPSNRAAAESRRIATEKIARALERCADLGRRELEPRDERIFPGMLAPVLVMEGGRPVVKPMRYQCRLPGQTAAHDRRFPGTYNARRDNLQGYWRELYGGSHGVLLVRSFYENVARTAADGRAHNVVLEFKPQPAREMLVACLWSRWTAPGEPELLSFAAITDEPPAEIAAAGHDRCVVAIRPDHLERWLSPASTPRATLQTILDDREPLVYEHALAA